jgi:hypothetical protein
MPNLSDKVLKLTTERTELIDQIISRMDVEISAAQTALLKTVISDFVDKLEKDDKGRIKNTLANKRKINQLDAVYSRYIQDSGVKIINTIVESVNKTLEFNGNYFSQLGTQAQLGAILAEVKATIAEWLGITEGGKLVQNGYLETLLKDPAIKNEIRDSIFKSIIAQKGYQEVKRDLALFIEGNRETLGALEKYYRNFVYDTFSQVDRTQSKIIADKLKLTYAIYEGGLIKTSRPFCIKRNGKVFTMEEIEAFDPPTAKPPNYNPVTDLGGYGCRHHLNWIPEVVAFALRPDLKSVK